MRIQEQLTQRHEAPIILYTHIALKHKHMLYTSMIFMVQSNSLPSNLPWHLVVIGEEFWGILVLLSQHKAHIEFHKHCPCLSQGL